MKGVLRPADGLLIVPPFALHDRPSLGVHLLQAVAREAGYEIQVLYANLLFAARFGEPLHLALSDATSGLYLGERLFARFAYGGPALGRDRGAALVEGLKAVRRINPRIPSMTMFSQLERQIPEWLASFTSHVADASYRLVGCTSSFEQNAACLAILKAVKRDSPHTRVIMGGANCEGEMAAGICTLSDAIDHVFAGESERTFVAFLRDLDNAEATPPRIIRGTPCMALDDIPTPDYTDYYTQLQLFLPDSRHLAADTVTLSYETSRGCWWGQKSHCTFCGLNALGMVFREKSPDRVLAELHHLRATHPNGSVIMTDNIMPYSYFRTVLPRLKRELPDLRIMYEQKANLTLAKVRDLVAAGVHQIQPGIEALSTGLLRLMAKGTTAAQNIALLRYAQVAGMRLHWNLIVGFPNDRVEFYEETLDLLPLLRHLQAPSICVTVFDRFSPYFDRPERYGIQRLRPMAYYGQVLPQTAAIDKIAYHFEGDFDTVLTTQPDLLERMVAEVSAWRDGPRTQLRIRRSTNGRYTLEDTRGLPGLPQKQTLDDTQAYTALVARPTREARPDYSWAIRHRLAVERDGRFIPLATADADLLAELEAKWHGTTPAPV